MLSHLQYQPALTTSHLQGVQDGREALVELDVHHGTNDRDDTPVGDGGGYSWGSISPACGEGEPRWLISTR